VLYKRTDYASDIIFRAEHRRVHVSSITDILIIYYQCYCILFYFCEERVSYVQIQSMLILMDSYSSVLSLCVIVDVKCSIHNIVRDMFRKLLILNFACLASMIHDLSPSNK
jgi:hypothetical protein